MSPIVISKSLYTNLKKPTNNANYKCLTDKKFTWVKERKQIFFFLVFVLLLDSNQKNDFLLKSGLKKDLKKKICPGFYALEFTL